MRKVATGVTKEADHSLFRKFGCDGRRRLGIAFRGRRLICGRNG